MKTKRCTGCKEQKPLADFWKDKKAKDGYCFKCKSCKTKRQKEYRDAAYHRRAQLKRLYGLSAEDYDRMFFEQNGVCAICGKVETAVNQFGVKRLAVDHRHSDGKIRGLLCQNCNNVLGSAKDNKEVLLKAILYLETNE